jgi:uncharacterized protein
MHPVLTKIIHTSPHLKWMGERTVFMVRHGSMAYGTNIEGSDEDFKGVTIPTKPYYLGSQHKFEQAELKDPDAVIYEISKFFNLAAACNPNIIEVLHVDPSDYELLTPIGTAILNNKDRFLSKRIRFTFGGYAYQQLKRIKLHRRYFINPPKAPPTRKDMGLPEQTLIPADQMMAAEADVQKELEKLNFDFLDGVQEATKIEIRGVMIKMLAEMKITVDTQWASSARKVGLDDNFIEIMQKERSYKNAKLEWDNFIKWKETRNRERYEMEVKYGADMKHGYHLIRLLRMAREILTTGKVLVKRPDREELIAIRNGAWTYEKLVEVAEGMNKELDELYKTCKVLPKTPDMKYLDELCIGLIEQMGWN